MPDTILLQPSPLSPGYLVQVTALAGVLEWTLNGLMRTQLLSAPSDNLKHVVLIFLAVLVG